MIAIPRYRTTVIDRGFVEALGVENVLLKIRF
jgi:hypothetical protein